MDPAALLEGRTRETKIRRDEAGRWFNDGVAIDHPKLVRAFNMWIEVAADGRYCLSNDINWAYVSIEGAPVFVESFEIDADGMALRFSDGRSERLDPTSLRQDPGGTLYCDARGGAMTGRFSRDAMVKLMSILDADDEGLYLIIAGEKVRAPMVDQPLSQPRPTLA